MPWLIVTLQQLLARAWLLRDSLFDCAFDGAEACLEDAVIERVASEGTSAAAGDGVRRAACGGACGVANRQLTSLFRCPEMPPSLIESH